MANNGHCGAKISPPACTRRSASRLSMSGNRSDEMTYVFVMFGDQLSLEGEA